MSIRKAIKLFFCIVFTIIQIYIQGQDINYPCTLQWHQPCYEKISEDIVVSYLFFDNASLYQTNKRTPRFWKTFSVNENVVADIKVTEQVWQSVTKEELDLIDVDLIRDTLYVNAYTEYTRKVPALKVEFFPFRKRGNQYEKLLSFRLQGSLRSVSARIHKSRTYTTNSVLSNDGFYKIGITKTGIHKITYDDFVRLGINVSSISTANIAVFGNGGRRLPESTSEPVFDDVQEVAIEVVDNNGNGIFEQSDYVLFYGVGVVHWDYSPSNSSFKHDLNFYTNYAYYFINVHAGVGLKKRVNTITSSPSSATHTVNTYYYYDVYEKDLINVNGVGRIWFSEDYNYTTSHSYSFSIPGISRSHNIFFRMGLAAKSSASSTFLVNINNAVSFGNPFGPSSDGSYREVTYNNYIPTSDNININISYSKPVNSAIGWLDYIELHATRSLAQHTGMISFRNPEIIQVGNVANYQFDTKGKNTQIWEVTDQHNIKRINGQRSGNTLSFTLEADSMREFVAFDGTEFNSVTTVGRVERQNLHSYGGLDFIIITHPNFVEAAERLASFRRSNDNMRVAVVTTTQVYNEFGSGAGDIGAIRNFIKMFYDRETVNNIPKNILLFGKTSYDPRNITETNSCLIPNYQGSNVFYKEDCLSTDNFFTKLADGKGNGNTGSMDMGIGRFPVLTVLQADNMVQKTLNYASGEDLTTSSNNSYVSNLSNWRNIIVFAADDWEESMFHMRNTENISVLMEKNYPYLNIEKIYCDAYKKESSSGGARYVEATNAINARFNKGCLMFTYFGHGGDDGWSHERVLMRSDINKWTNKYCLPFVYTACCTFARYDKIIGTSPAEDMLLKTDGGAIALITSTRNSGSSSNENFGKRIYTRAFEQTNGAYLTMGEVHAKAHTDVNGGGVEIYVLLGDPSATLAHPKFNVVTDSINAVDVNVYSDTIKALQFVTIKGHVTDNNNIMPFNGWVYPTIYDKMDSVPVVNPLISENTKFPLQKSIIFKGKSKVEEGYFSFSFMTPKDINYEYGLGKISYYAMEKGKDAQGYYQVPVGGMENTNIDDEEGPKISLYFNDAKFVNGGLTSTTPVLHAKISDSSGINTTGAGIGHDIIALVDGDMSKSVVLNDFFEYDTNSYMSGSLSYVLSALNEGPHTLTLRAWDVVNNMNEETINFEVVKDEDLKISHVLNYPNPFTTSTQFFFEHNRPNTLLHIRIQLFTISGKVVKTIIQSQQNMGFRSDPIHWNGLDDFGDKLARGIYIYKLQVMTPDGKSTEKIEKIVIL
ncbi:MAG: type IX secretion system sortase PorU [Bacteroidales bacterium]|jgi:hypothetical protein|nr:type IX secretion system sortase PorU [Bacteroidales bacterium]